VRRALLLTLLLAAVAAPAAHAGGLRVHVSGTGDGTIGVYPGNQHPCNKENSFSGGCIIDDGGGGLILMATPDPGSTFDGWPLPQCFPYPGGYCQIGGSSGPSCCNELSVSFTKLRYSLAVATAGTGQGSVTSSPDGSTCTSTCSTT
jgi:hypothetical protein